MKDKIIVSSVMALTLTLMIVSILALTFNGRHEEAKESTVGQLSQGSSFKNITSSDASSTAPVIVRLGAGFLDRIVIASSSPMTSPGVGVYDGTATTSGTLIGRFNGNNTEDEIEIYAAVTKGIVLDLPASFNGSWTVMYR